MNLVVKLSIFVATMAIAMGAYLSYVLSPSNYLPWHEGPKWEPLLTIYDTITKEMYKDCESFNVSTAFGSTFGYSCGNALNPPVVMFHGGTFFLFCLGYFE